MGAESSDKEIAMRVANAHDVATERIVDELVHKVQESSDGHLLEKDMPINNGLSSAHHKPSALNCVPTVDVIQEIAKHFGPSLLDMVSLGPLREPAHNDKS